MFSIGNLFFGHPFLQQSGRCGRGEGSATSIVFYDFGDVFDVIKMSFNATYYEIEDAIATAHFFSNTTA